jgi:hypothetical protein
MIRIFAPGSWLAQVVRNIVGNEAIATRVVKIVRFNARVTSGRHEQCRNRGYLSLLHSILHAADAAYIAKCMFLIARKV